MLQEFKRWHRMVGTTQATVLIAGGSPILPIPSIGATTIGGLGG